MITIQCSNPICGKSFLFDETKFPDARKVQCPHCKTIQDLKIEDGDKGQEEAFFEKPAKPAPAPVVSSPIESFSAPKPQKEDFFTETPPEPRQQTILVAEEPRKPNRLLLLVVLPVLVVLAGLLAYLFWPDPEPTPLQPLPAFEAGISASAMQITEGDTVSVSITVTPLPDSGLLVRLSEGDRQLTENTTGSFTIDTPLQTPGKVELSFWIEVFRVADSATVRDTASVAIEVLEKKAVVNDQPEVTSHEVTRFDLRRKASRAKWLAEYRNKSAVVMAFGAPLKKSGDFYGEAKIATNVKMEDGGTKNGIEIIPGDKEGSKVTGEFEIADLPKNPVFKAHLGFANDSESNGEAVIEIRGQLQDGSYKILGVRSKRKNGSLVLLEYPIAPYDIRKIRIDVISKKRGQNKVVLVNPMIAQR